jgi:hypothetical protein
VVHRRPRRAGHDRVGAAAAVTHDAIRYPAA